MPDGTIWDPPFGDEILIAPLRAARPNEFTGARGTCAFCPGNESQTPPEIARAGTPEHWSARAFANKYPIVAEPQGTHEVIADAPSHDSELTAQAVTLWRDRYAFHARTRVPVVFKNSGLYGGATLVHPHTQLVALSDVPPRLQHLLAYQTRLGRCVTCAEIERARAAGLIVAENDELIAYVRDADRFGRELSIAPLSCTYDFAVLSEQAAATIARAVCALFARPEEEPPSSNALLYAVPSHSGALHWRLQLVERRGTLAGFELLSGLYVRSASAQESAQRWRQLLGLSW